MAEQRDPEAGSGGVGVPVPEGVALSSCWISMMRTVTRVSIRKALCRRVLSPALVGPPNPAALHHLLDHQKGSQRKLSLQGWVRREVGLGASQEPSPLSLVFSKVEAISLPPYCIL